MQIPIAITISDQTITEIHQRLIENGKTIARNQLENMIETYIKELNLSSEITKIVVNGGKIHYGKDLYRHIEKRVNVFLNKSRAENMRHQTGS